MGDAVRDDGRQNRLRLWQTGLPHGHRPAHRTQGGNRKHFRLQLSRKISDHSSGAVSCTPPNPRLQVLSMSKEEFSEFKENEGWEEDEEEDEDEVSRAFSYDGLPELKPSWKWLVHEAARLTLQSYGDEGVEPMEEGEEAAPNRRHLNALRVRHGQKSILSTLMKVTEKS